MHLEDSPSAASPTGILSSLPGVRTAPAPSAAVLEVMVYDVRDPEGFVPLAARVHRTASAYFGFEASLALVSLGPSPLFADLVAWTSLDAALVASHRLDYEPAFTAYQRALGEVRLFARYALVGSPRRLFEALRDAPVVEISAYGVRSRDFTAELHGRLHERLRTAPGFRVSAPLHSLGDATLRADLVGWRSVEAAAGLGAALGVDPELRPIARGLVERSVLSFFTALG